MLYKEAFLKAKELARFHANSLGYEIFDADLICYSGRFTLKFLADRPQGGISIGECASLNRQISGLLDSNAVFDQDYILEVSSPGVDRWLRTHKDFLRAKGRCVRVFLREPVMSKAEILGVLEDVKDENIFLNIEGNTCPIPINKIIKGKQVIE